MADVAGMRLEKYILESRIGEGGMATVYKARHADLDTLHAIKLLKQRSGAVAERMLQEGRIQARLRHPNVVGVTDVIRKGKDVGLVMDYVEGLSLGLLTYGFRMLPDQIDAAVAGILDGVEMAHGLGLVHRDLKPDNILMEYLPSGAPKEEWNDLRPRIMDFGLAKAVRDELRVGRSTRVGAMMGTPQFMAPEQYQDASGVDRRADIYSLGAIFYEMISGKPVFEDADLPVLLARVQRGEWTPLDEVAPGTPSTWVDAVHACLHVDPEDRPEDIAALRRIWKPQPRTESTWSKKQIAYIGHLEQALPEPESDLFETGLIGSADDSPDESGAPGFRRSGPLSDEDTMPSPVVDSPMASGASLPSRPSTPGPGAWLSLGVGGVLIFVLFLLLGIGLATWMSGSFSSRIGTAEADAGDAGDATAGMGPSPETEEPEEPEEPEPTEPTEPEPAVDAEPTDVPEPAEDPEPAVADGPTPAPQPGPTTAPVPAPVAPDAQEPRVEAPRPTEEPVPVEAPDPEPAIDPTLASVSVDGFDGYLYQDGRRQPLTGVQPGDYDLYVFFDDNQAASKASNVTLGVGQTLNMKCDRGLKACRPVR